MSVFVNAWAKVLSYIHYVKTHLLLVDPQKRLYGILLTILGWLLIGFGVVYTDSLPNKIPQNVSFILFFLSGFLFVLLAALVLQIPLRVSEKTDKNQKTHFSPKSRLFLILLRGFIAIASYYGFIYSKDALGIVDDSAIFGADALVYALLMWWILKEKRSFLDWLGIIIATFGVSIPFIANALSDGFWVSIEGGLIGLFSSVFLSIIFFMNCVLVRHEPATRIAFYQLLLGTLVAFIVCLISWPSIRAFLPQLTWSMSGPYILSGVLFAIALICFFRAFLYTEVILIAISGYALDPIVVLLNRVFNQERPTLLNLITLGLILIGTALLYFEEHKHSSNKRTTRFAFPIYEPTIAEEFEENDQLYQQGVISTDIYRAKRKLFNDLLFKISDEMIDTDIDKIELEKGLVFFHLHHLGIRLECDEDLQSTPLEVLNFGTFWREELKFIYELMESKKTFVDFGAQVGWLSLNLAKTFPQCRVYAFEPNFKSFSHLVRNVKSNQASNIEAINLKLSDHKGEKTYYLLPEERILTPEDKALIYTDLSKIECDLISLDAFSQEHQIDQIDFIAGHAVGNELEILKGAENVLKKDHPILFLELFEEFCEEYDYTLKELLNYLKGLDYFAYQLQEKEIMTSQNFKPIENPSYFFFHKEAHRELLKHHSARLKEVL